MSKIIFITGTSSGFGNALAKAALRKGHSIVATARKPESLEPLVEPAKDRAFAVALDVTDQDSVRAAVNAALKALRPD